MNTSTTHRAAATLWGRIALAIIIVIGTAGCTSVRKKVERDRVLPEMFDNDHDKLAAAFDKIVREQTTRADLEKLGFDLKAKNLQILVGVPAFRELLGQEVFRNMDQNGFDKRLPELNRYSMLQITLRNTVKTSDYFYINKKTTTLVGWDTAFTIVLHDDVVVYAAPRKVYRDETKTDRAFLQGLLEILGRMGQAIGAARPL